MLSAQVALRLTVGICMQTALHLYDLHPRFAVKLHCVCDTGLVVHLLCYGAWHLFMLVCCGVTGIWVTVDGRKPQRVLLMHGKGVVCCRRRVLSYMDC